MKTNNYILIGDFNFGGNHIKEQNILPTYENKVHDLWKDICHLDEQQIQCHFHSHKIDEQMADEDSSRFDEDFPNDGISEDLQLKNGLFSKFKDNPELDTIHANRLLEVLQTFGKNPSQMDCNRRIQALEEDEKFELTFEDFIEILEEPWTSVNNDRNTLHKALAKFDHTKEGYIDIEKFREIMRTLGEPLSDDDIDDLIQLGLNDEEKKIDIEHLLDQLLGNNT